MWDLDDEFGDLPEIDPGTEFRDQFSFPVVLNREVVRTVKTEEVVVSDRVVDVLASAPEEILPLLGANEIVRVPQVESKVYNILDEGGVCKLSVEGGRVLEGDKAVLVWARNNNTALFRDLVFKNYAKYLDCAEESDPEESLAWYRMLRSVTPVLNVISKKIDVIPAGLSTLGKIRDMLRYASELGAPRDVVAFGVGNFSHLMAYHPAIITCVDTDSWGHGSDLGYFQRGNLSDWRAFVSGSEMILSDCSIGSDEAMGMEIPRSYYDHYKDMVKSGYYVLTKINKFGIPWTENWRVASISYYREHNFEAFVLISPYEEQNVYEMRGFDIIDRMREANNSRMRRILSREFNTSGVVFRYTEQELNKAINLSDVIYKTGEKNYSVLKDVFQRYSSDLGREWRALCYDKNFEVGVLDDVWTCFLAIPVELPCILIDVEFLAADKERLFASFHKRCVMQWDDDVGWIAVELKIDKN